TDRAVEIVSEVDGLRRLLLNQASLIYCLSLSRHDHELFEPGAPLFGDGVEAKFPALMSEDISEAGKCLALNRWNAAVFHLMRVMEIALQKLGDVLNVSLVNEKQWQNILDEVNREIRKLDHKLPRTIALAEISFHLYAVKLAWRNEVMHPKQTYTHEEADAIFRNVRIFIRELAGVI
ncbi:MAG: hypothetical protein KGQ82_12160, partial [Alphaproteobacteria bacterium]|nr:hypothetical protein [Alphaproteobacteria bacterium]